MRKMKKITIIMLAAALVTLSACAKTGTGKDIQAAAAYPGTQEADMAVLDITAEPVEMNSILAYDSVGMSVLTQCISGIARLDANDQPMADLAEKWEINDDSSEYTIYLRRDAKWSNGDPVTAKDYYFAWVTQMKSDTGSYMASFLYDNIKNGQAYFNGEAEEEELGIQIVDDYTLKLQWERPMPDGLFLLSMPMYFPVNQKAYEEIGADQYGKDADKMLTNGAYKLTEWVHDNHIMLEKSEDYFNASCIKIPKVKLVMIGDTNTRLNAFTTGDIDMSSLYGEQIVQIKQKSENAIHSYIDGGSWYIGFNMENEYLKNVNLRKALAYAIDVQSLLDNVIADGSVAADGLVPSAISGAGGKSYTQARGSLFGYNLDKAIEHLELALKELKTSASDIKLSLDVADTSYSQNQAAYIQQQWKKNLGIDVAVKVQGWKALEEAKKDGDFNISIEANGPWENTAMTFLEYFDSDNANNLGKYDNHKYDKLLIDAEMESDPEKKQELMIEAEKLLMEDAALGPLYFTCTTYAVSEKLEGLVRTPFQYFNVCLGASIKAD